MHFSDARQLTYSCQQVFDLVADIEHYPEFLPGWCEARILERQDNRLLTEQRLQTGPAMFHFHTTALLTPCEQIRITADDGPFRELLIDWRFLPVDEEHCRVTLAVSLTMRPGLVNGALQLLLETGSSQLLPLFEDRARRLYV